MSEEKTFIVQTGFWWFTKVRFEVLTESIGEAFWVSWIGEVTKVSLAVSKKIGLFENN